MFNNSIELPLFQLIMSFLLPFVVLMYLALTVKEEQDARPFYEALLLTLLMFIGVALLSAVEEKLSGAIQLSYWIWAGAGVVVYFYTAKVSREYNSKMRRRAALAEQLAMQSSENKA